MEQSKKMTKKEFWIRLSSYILMGGVAPFAFLVWRFKLFSQVNKLMIGGWGIIGIIVIAVFFTRLIKAVRKGLPYSYGTQILTMLCKVSIPLLTVFVCAYFLRDIMGEFSQFLGVLFVCETIAGFINPIPQWAHDNQIEEQENVLKQIFSSFKKEEEQK